MLFLAGDPTKNQWTGIFSPSKATLEAFAISTIELELDSSVEDSISYFLPLATRISEETEIKMKHILTLLISLVLLNDALAAEKPTSDICDVVVIGGTPAGIAAAIAAARAGKSVILIEEAPVLGGVLASGVLRLDDQYVESNSGVMEEFRQRVKRYHRTVLAEDPLVKAHIKQSPRQRWNLAEGRAWEPHTAARIYAEMVGELKSITSRFNEVAVDVKMEGERVVGVVTQDRDNQGVLGDMHDYAARVIIDATYEADLAAFAKVPFRIGREARSPEEPHAGRIYTTFFRSVAGTLPDTILPGSTGEADDRSQAFTYRLTAKDYGRPDHPFRLKEPPPGYNPAKYSWNRTKQPEMPNGKYDLLGISMGGDLTGYGTRWVLADWKERVEIAEIYRNHDLGWLYFIQTQGGSPNIGLPDDEFTDNNHLPYRLYVRQGRRIEGLYSLTESDIHKDLRGNGLRGPLHSDSVAIGTYLIDSHNVQNPTAGKQPRYGEGAAEGTLSMGDVSGPYQIPYGVMVPKNRKGVLFPVGISSTHVAMSSVRMEPVWSALGQAAGVAAALAIDRKLELSQVTVKDIQDELLRQRCALFFYSDLPGNAPAFEAVQKLSLLGAAGDLGVDEIRSAGDGKTKPQGYPDAYFFRPNEPITRGEFSRMLVKALQIPISITGTHFRDVPRGHPAFKYVETLYDHSSQSKEPFFDYEVRKDAGKPKANGAPLTHPDREVSGIEANKILAGLLQGKATAWPKPDAFLTRGEAAQLIDQHLKQVRQ